LKQWIKKAKDYLAQRLGKVPQERNARDWKQALSPKRAKLCHHICAFATLLVGAISSLA
jgi:hypothetical protein